MLKILDLPLARRKVRRVGESLLEKVSGVDQCRGLLLEELVEAPLAGDERQSPSIPSSYNLPKAAEPARGVRLTFAVDQTPPFSALACLASLHQKNAIILPLAAIPRHRKGHDTDEHTAANCTYSHDVHPLDYLVGARAGKPPPKSSPGRRKEIACKAAKAH